MAAAMTSPTTSSTTSMVVEEAPHPITAARTPEELRAALLPLLPPGQWDVRCNAWGLVLYPAEQTRSAAAA